MTDALDLIGNWRSKYEFYSTSRREQLTSEHELVAQAHDGHIILETVPGSQSYIFIRLSLDGKVATGSWHETTDPEGPYKGATYHGSLQLILSNDKTKLKGKWIGFGRNFDVKDGPWELVKVIN